ncbi:helix-turn-helix domain-containing protein [Rhizobium mesoamericanum]|uniref:helix-turn-helix domain-containing protein n=1 Tax=Rhizobium mesoamericanum TaxID=1079800 RepID=UPI00351FD81F
MRPIEFIRTQVFKQPQSAFARLAGVSQGTVSKWEAGKLAPSQEEMNRIRSAAIRLAMEWKDEAWQDEWFFVVPRNAFREANTQ